MPRELSNASDIATEYQNVAGRESEILTFQPDDGTGLVIDGLVAKGEEVGIPIFGKLFAEDGSEMPLDTTLAWKFEAPGDDDAPPSRIPNRTSERTARSPSRTSSTPTTSTLSSTS